MGQFALSLAPVSDFENELDEPLLYHDISRPGFTSLVTPGGVRRQVSFKLHELPQNLATIRARSTDAYIAQNEFWKPNRRVVNCSLLTSNYIDLDTYKIPGIQGLSPRHLGEMMLIACDDLGIPEPTAIVYSGRGLQAKWVFETTVPSAAMPRWQAVQDELFRRLKHLGADERALDASRVLRLVNTINTRSGEFAHVVHRARIPTMGSLRRPDGVIAHDFEVLAETLLPVSRADIKERAAEREELQAWEAGRREAEAERKRAAVRHGLVLVPGDAGPRVYRPGGTPLVPSRLAWDRLSDLRRLPALRGWQDGAPPGQRNTFVFVGACLLATARLARDFRLEVRELAREFAPSWSAAEVTACVSSVLNRAEAAHRGEKVEFRGEDVDPRYRFSNARLVDLFCISETEQEGMKTIIGRPEGRRRDRARKDEERRASGSLTRAEYLGRAQAVGAQARELKGQGLSLSQIAKTMGISKASAGRHCSQV